MKRRVHMTINPNIYQRAQILMEAQSFDDFSSFVEQLIRAESERLQAAGITLPKKRLPPSPEHN
jgi:hypothetical protein